MSDWLDELRVVRTKSSGKVHAARVWVDKCVHGTSGRVISECGVLRSSLDRVVLYDEDPPVVNCVNCRNGVRRWVKWTRDQAQHLHNQAERTERKADNLLLLLGAELQEAS